MPVDTARALAGIVREMPTGHVEALARGVAPLGGPDRARWPSVLGAVPQAAYRQHAERLLQAWEAAPGLSGAAVALALLAAVAARDDERRDQVVEVVATGPASRHVSLRQTRAVVLDLLSRATREVLVVSFAAYREMRRAARRAGAQRASRPYLPSTSRRRPCGSPITRWPSAPTIVSAATSALMMASSVA
jgi:hypothetical protein